MAAIDFPNSPTLNQEFTANDRTWIWNGTVWANKAVDTSVSRYAVQDTAPSSPVNGDVWFNSTNARTYVYYDSFWVESNPALDGKSGVNAVASPITNSGTQSAAVLGLDYSALQYGQNAIINGAFDIWQRGTSLSAGGFLADRWFFDSDGSVLSQSRQTFTPGTAPVAGYEGAYYLNFTKNATGSYGGVYQKIEDVRTFAGQSATLSFWAKANAATTMTSRVSQEFGSGGSTTVNLTDQTVSLTTSWQRFTLTYSFGALTGKTIGTSSFVKWLFFAAGSGAANVDLWGVQLEAGSVATPFKRNAPSIQAELAACQRYYQRLEANTNAYMYFAQYQTTSATGGIAFLELPTSMRTGATSVDYSAVGVGTLGLAGGPYSVSAITINSASKDKVTLAVTNSSSSWTARQYGQLIANNNGAAYVGVSAEL